MSLERRTKTKAPALAELADHDAESVCLCEVLDRVLNKGVVVAGDATISVADIDLIYLGLQLVLTSIETARQGFCRAPLHVGAGMGVAVENKDAFAGKSPDRV